MAIDPKVEEPLRDMLGHAIRHELDDLVERVTAVSDQTFAECLKLCVVACGYIVVDVAGRWPLDVDVREGARIAAESATRLPVAEEEIYEFLSRSVFGFEAIDAVFAEPLKVVQVPLFTAAGLLSKFRPETLPWWEYLDQIWGSAEIADQMRVEVLPALIYRVKAESARAQRASGAEPGS